MKNSTFEKWISTLKGIHDYFPFGELQQKKNEEGRLHCDNGPADITPTRITHYQNGRRHGVDVDIYGSIFYYYENIVIPSHYFTHPQNLTLEEVLQHPNAEVRYVGIKIIGYDKIKKECKIIHQDNKKEMELFEIDKVFTDPFRILQVKNSTPEKDGTYKKYFLTVPPNMRTCKQAVAWTFYMTPEEYNPIVET